MPWWVLLLMLSLTWCLWTIAAVMGKAVDEKTRRVVGHKRGGVSIAPVIPLFPLALFAIAKLADIFAAPWGTRVIGALHLPLALFLLISVARYWRRLRCQHRPE